MANLLKPKLIVATASIGIAFALSLMDKKFYDSHIAKRWGSPLQWSDFTGKIDPLSKYDASVSSTIQLEFDSSSSTYKAYAVQKNVYSWVRESSRSDDLLNHEQYHFNITEYFARLMNKHILDSLGQSQEQFQSKLNRLLISENVMQSKYDEQTKHNKHRDQQGLWEYKIDSLITSNSTDSGWLTDPFTGVTIFFPSKPTFSQRADSKTIIRLYSLEKNDFILTLLSIKISDFNADSTIAKISKIYYSSFEAKKLNVIQYNKEIFKLRIASEDSLGGRTDFIWRYNYPYLNGAGISYHPYNDTDTIGYTSIFNSFANSLYFDKVRK